MTNEIIDLKATEKQSYKKDKHSVSSSLCSAIVFIGIGLFWLASNLGWVSFDLNWRALFSLWPVLLIFAGLRVLAQQAPRGVSQLLSMLVGVGLLAFLAATLLFSDQIPAMQGLTASADIQRQQVVVARDGATAANVYLDFGPQMVEVTGVNDSNDILSGHISYAGELSLIQEIDTDRIADVSLNVNSGSWWQAPQWTADDSWSLALNESIPMDVELDLGSGRSVLDLSSLTLTDLQIDGASGSSQIDLPSGDYAVLIDSASGSSVLTLPESGQIDMKIDSGSGSVEIILPRSMQAYIEVDGGSGAWRVDSSRLEQVSEDGNDSVWQTADYNEDGANRVYLELDGGSGSIQLTSE